MKSSGILKVVEVRSRFDDASSGGGIKKFLKFLKRAGFDLSQSSNDKLSDNNSRNNNGSSNKSSNNSNSNNKTNSKVTSKKDTIQKSSTQQNKMFFDVECRKSDRVPQIDANFSVKACVYKKR